MGAGKTAISSPLWQDPYHLPLTLLALLTFFAFFAFASHISVGEAMTLAFLPLPAGEGGL